jgi:orotate phosphoribosyltransferase
VNLGLGGFAGWGWGAGSWRAGESRRVGEDEEVEAGVIELVRPRRGHFELGTGFHGDVWLDLDALFLRPALLEPHIGELAEQLREHQVDAVCGPAEGGAFLALALATRLGVAFLPGYRAAASPPGYRLPNVPGGIQGWQVALADDAVNAGTAIRACATELQNSGAAPVAVAALLALGPAEATVRDTMGLPLYAAAQLNSQAWPAASCPLCASGVPLDEARWEP